MFAAWNLTDRPPPWVQRGRLKHGQAGLECPVALPLDFQLVQQRFGLGGGGQLQSVAARHMTLCWAWVWSVDVLSSDVRA